MGVPRLRRADREDRLEKIKALGRIVHRLGKDGDLVGMVTREGQEKYLRVRDEGWLSIELLTPHPRSSDLTTDFSEIEVSAYGRKGTQHSLG